MKMILIYSLAKAILDQDHEPGAVQFKEVADAKEFSKITTWLSVLIFFVFL